MLQKTAPEATFKIISGKLQSSWCDECVSFAYFALVAPMLASFMPFVKGLLLKNFPVFQESARCYATRMDGGGGGGTRLVFGYGFEILTLFRTKNFLTSYPV